MLLIIMPPFIPIQEKTIVLIGHIVSVQMGLWMTRSLEDYWEGNRIPALPCSVIFVSFYTLLVDHFFGILWARKSGEIHNLTWRLIHKTSEDFHVQSNNVQQAMQIWTGSPRLIQCTSENVLQPWSGSLRGDCARELFL